MKKLSKHLTLLLLVFPLLFSCSDSDDEIKELQLSVEGPTIMTENVDYEFEILNGNGGYTATVSETNGDDDAIVTIEGNKVTVNILVGNGNGVEMTITDRKNKAASLFIMSTHESLHISDYTVFMDEGQTTTVNNLNFGAGGPYTLERIRGNAATAIVESGKVKVTSQGLGDTYYKVRDRRGSVARLTIQTTLQKEITRESNSLEITAINNLSISTKLMWGEEWYIVTSTDNIIEYVSVGRPVNAVPGSESDYDFLFITTVDEGKGTDSVTLKNKDGDLATVKVLIK